MKETQPNFLLYLLLGIAFLLGAIVIAYPYLFVQEPAPVVVLTDGTQISGEGSPQELLNINTATEDEFQELKGIGPVLAKRIVEYREANGGFARLEDLKQVAGIGEQTFAKLENQITLGDTGS